MHLPRPWHKHNSDTCSIQIRICIYTDAYTDTDAYRSMQAYTYRHIRNMQTYRHIQTHTDTCRSTCIYAGVYMQTHTDTYRHMLMNRYLYLCRCADADIQRHLRIICIIIDIRINLGLFLMGQSLAKDKNLVNFMYRKHNFFTLKNNSI